MSRHLHLLGVLETLWGGLAMTVGVSMLLLAAGALAALVDPLGTAVEFAAGVTAAIFAVIGVFALLWGGAHTWAAMLLTRRQPLGRMMSLALAIVNLLVLPFGTALAAYAFWVLLSDEGRRLFDTDGSRQAAGGSPAGSP